VTGLSANHTPDGIPAVRQRVPDPVLAEVMRGGVVESRHRGRVVALTRSGRRFALGDVDTPIFPRSSLKPVQAAAMLRAGLAVSGAELAVVAGTHSGTEAHVARVRAVLAAAGLSERDLRCPAQLPLDPTVSDELVRAGGGPERIRMNCSGKHAGMVATCVAAGWPVESYLDPDHPLQRHIRAVVEELTGAPVAATVVDGCGAPLFAVSPTGLAVALRAIATAPTGTAEHRVAQAMRDHPDMVAGAGRSDTILMRSVPGLITKDGAEGVAVAAASDGRTVAVKIDDGAKRAAQAALCAALVRLGLLSPAAAATPPLDVVALPPVLGGGARVGQVRPAAGSWPAAAWSDADAAPDPDAAPLAGPGPGPKPDPEAAGGSAALAPST
jgi:L-asparaginase II